ncbi:hypothetical protein JTB14_031745 [Gonioctena quinquepunctata]|nr:hypothetical protein JTB14_031745 [Gonioctena quinquepunctata]
MIICPLTNIQKLNSQVEKVEADSTTWWLRDDVLVEDVTETGPIQFNHVSSTTLDEGEVELNWDNGRYMPEIVDGSDDGESDATIEVEEADERNDDVNININNEAPMELNDEFFEYVDVIFRQFDDEELD